MSMLKRDPIGESIFESVRDEIGKIHIQCTVCADHTIMYDELAMVDLRHKPFGRIRVGLLYPYWIRGFAKFWLAHRHCMESSY